MLAGVEPVDIVDEEVVAILDVDANHGLLGERVLGQLQVMQVPAGDGRHVVPAGSTVIVKKMLRIRIFFHLDLDETLSLFAVFNFKKGGITVHTKETM